MASQKVVWRPVPWYDHAFAWGIPFLLVLAALFGPQLLGMKGHEVPACYGTAHDLAACTK